MNETGKNRFQYVFGPVPSRRLGRSLGIDTVPFKTCTYDCVYCQLGRTTVKTSHRDVYVPLKVVIQEIRNKLEEEQTIDYITLSGSGEPTLYSDLAVLIERIKEITDIPVAVLTNSSLLWDREVRQALNKADLVIPSLDAGDGSSFMRVNRPVESIGFDRMVYGLRQFRESYRGLLWLEVFLLDQITATEEMVRLMATHVRSINPDRVQLNTVIRPPAEKYALSVPKHSMLQFAKMFECRTEVIADYTSAFDTGRSTASREDIILLLKRRPCTLEDIAAGLYIHRNEAIKHLGHLTAEGIISTMENEKGVFYILK